MRLILCLILLSSLAACFPAAEVETQITRFHDTTAAMPPGTFSYFALPTERRSLEYQSYADKIATQLGTLGYRFQPGAGADYSVAFSMEQGESETQLVYDSDPGYSGLASGFYGDSAGYSNWRYGSYWDDPFYEARTYAKVVTPYTLKLRMVDLQRPGKPTVFEGKATTTDYADSLSDISGCLIAALLFDFPGMNAESTSVVLPANSCMNASYGP